ncbi:hypothetical protein CHS0354_015904 [Potamilus streckersoni]|uniref:Uncharacterized protein n=1 Tax=Potamilus streckersoni TaxID=2493646 RepID=A0AAE0SDV5_9BIVA|nr:hypothetical protein CHS0354_015904 [Potamilus streckersoni]
MEETIHSCQNLNAIIVLGFDIATGWSFGTQDRSTNLLLIWENNANNNNWRRSSHRRRGQRDNIARKNLRDHRCTAGKTKQKITVKTNRSSSRMFNNEQHLAKEDLITITKIPGRTWQMFMPPEHMRQLMLPPPDVALQPFSVSNRRVIITAPGLIRRVIEDDERKVKRSWNVQNREKKRIEREK